MGYGNQELHLEGDLPTNGVGRFLMHALYASVKNPPTHAGKLDFSHTQALTHAAMLGQSQTSMVVHQWLASGVDIEDVYLEGVTPAARLIGQWWCDDVVDFATATLAFGRLRQLLFDLSPLFLMDATAQARGLSCFMVGEFQAQHSMGLFMVSEFFRRNGWQVRADECESGDDLLKKMTSDWFDLMSVSLSNESQIPILRGLIPEIRQASPNPALKIMAGGALLTVFPEIALEIGADAVTHDARTAQTTALSLVSNEQYKRQLEMTLSNVN